MGRPALSLLAAVLIPFLAPAAMPAEDPSGTPRRPRPRQGPRLSVQEVIKRWKDGPVRYIMSWKEDEAVRQLRTVPELERFITEFWAKRDPSPGTIENEFRRTFWQRVLDANLRFRDSTIPGWKTDRGKIFILLGAPEEVTHSTASLGAGGDSRYRRDVERWLYRQAVLAAHRSRVLGGLRAGHLDGLEAEQQPGPLRHDLRGRHLSLECQPLRRRGAGGDRAGARHVGPGALGPGARGDRRIDGRGGPRRRDHAPVRPGVRRNAEVRVLPRFGRRHVRERRVPRRREGPVRKADDGHHEPAGLHEPCPRGRLRASLLRHERRAPGGAGPGHRDRAGRPGRPRGPAWRSRPGATG